VYYEKHNAGATVVKYGETGETFYVIIEGVVGVHVPFAIQDSDIS
jgi:CRP-like cAMP-binding protein